MFLNLTCLNSAVGTLIASNDVISITSTLHTFFYSLSIAAVGSVGVLYNSIGGVMLVMAPNQLSIRIKIKSLYQIIIYIRRNTGSWTPIGSTASGVHMPSMSKLCPPFLKFWERCRVY